MKVYPLFESELHTLSFFNGQMLVFSSVGSFLLALAFGTWTNAFFVEKLTPEGAILAYVVAPVLCLLGLVAFGLAYWAYTKRQSSWDAVQQESAGEAHNSKLIAKDVLAIRDDPRTHRAIAADYGVGHTIIGNIKRRIKWRHL